MDKDTLQWMGDISPHAVVVVDVLGTIIQVNAKTCALFGYDRNRLLGQAVDMLVPVRLREVHRADRTAFMNNPGERPMGKGRDLWGRHQEGWEIPLEVALVPVTLPEGPAVIASVIDLSVRKDLEKRLREERDEVTVTLYSIGDAVITTGTDGRVQRLNPVAARLTGWSEKEAVGRQLSEVFRIINEETREPADDPVRRCLREGHVVELADHTLLIARDGTEFGIEDSAAPIPRDDHTFSGAVLVFRDVTAQRLANQQLQFLAQRDPLTTLYNRHSFEQHLDAAYHRASRGAERHALIYIDLDQFKLVNDTAGHQVGDQLLVAVARYLHGRVRAGDVLARMGGDEFALLASDIDEDSALALAKDIV
ncbi:PAS domain S-box protein, partial [Aquisalimonas sp.]|uniref:PAS domain S-box protein n=1 Tax=Aquisalimonas sp. TaxID=1872621 RepID=UPI0025BD3695